MKHKRWIALLLTSALAAGALSVTAFASDAAETEPVSQAEEQTKTARCGHRHGQKPEKPDNAIGRQAAREAALAAAGVNAEQASKVKARLAELEDGTVVYKVHFTDGETWYSFRIDAVTGEVLSKTEKTAAEHAAEKAEKKAEKADAASEESSGRQDRGTHGRHRSGGAEAGRKAKSGAEETAEPQKQATEPAESV